MRCSAATGKLTIVPMPNRYFLCELRLQRPRECSAFVLLRKFRGSHVNEVNLTQVYFLGCFRIASPGIPAGHAGGRSFHRATPSLAACPLSSPSVPSKQACGSTADPAVLPSNQALHEVCAK